MFGIRRAEHPSQFVAGEGPMLRCVRIRLNHRHGANTLALAIDVLDHAASGATIGRPALGPGRTQRAPSAIQLPGQEGPQDWRGAASASWAANPAKLSAVVRPPFIIGGQVDTARRVKVGGEPYDASDECQSLGRFNLPGSNGLRREVDGVQMADSSDGRQQG
jgi:hypothetical protein